MEEDIKILENYIREWNDTDVEQALQNLIARYKELEDKNKTLETLLQGNLYQMYLYYKELAGRYQANSISKDKVKEKIEELDIQISECEYADDDIEERKQDIEKEKRLLLRDKKTLQDLLGEE